MPRLSRRAPLWVALLALAPLLLATVSVPASAGTERAKGAAAFTFGTHNSLRGTGRFTGFADIICWQEVALPQSKEKLLKSLRGYDHYIEAGVAGQVPTSWRADRDIPVLACGDFNRVRYLDLPGLDPIRRQGGRTGLDHLYRDTRGVRARPARSEGNAGSDHPRLVTTIRLR